MEQQGRKIIVAEDEPHRVLAIQALLAGTAHEIVSIAISRQEAIRAIGDAGLSGANLILLDGNLEPEPGQETDDFDGADAKAVLAAIAAAREADKIGAFTMDVIAISSYPMTEYGITEGITRDIGKGGIPELPDVIAEL